MSYSALRVPTKPLLIHQPKLVSADAQYSPAYSPKLKASSVYKNASLLTMPIPTLEDVSSPVQLDSSNWMPVNCVLRRVLKTLTFMAIHWQDSVKALALTLNIVIQPTEPAFLHARQTDFSCTTLHVLSSVPSDFMLMGQEFACHLAQPTLMEKIRLHNAWQRAWPVTLKIVFAWLSVMMDCLVKTLFASHHAQPQQEPQTKLTSVCQTAKQVHSYWTENANSLVQQATPTQP